MYENINAQKRLLPIATLLKCLSVKHIKYQINHLLIYHVTEIDTKFVNPFLFMELI